MPLSSAQKKIKKMLRAYPRPLPVFRLVNSRRCSVSASLEIENKGVPSPNASAKLLSCKERVKKLFHNVDISASSYDTAWVAMVPSQDSPDKPLFPKCLNWLLDNQLQDGSWGLPHHNPLLLRDVLSSTLASMLALKRWGIGEQLVDKGARFIESNFSTAMVENLQSPIGFDIIFPGMLEYGRKLNLNLQLETGALNALVSRRDEELKRCYASQSQEIEAYLAYISEGIGELQNWNMVMKYQKKNGSLFNSPSTTAAALMNVKNAGCHNYLNSVVEKFGGPVPAVAPHDTFLRLCLSDRMLRLGISRHFWDEIENVLDDSYRCWMQGDEDIFSDASTCALTFRLLREQGYDVSSGPLKKCFLGKHCFSGSLVGHLKEIVDVLELYRASEMIITEEESFLQEQRIWCKALLEKVISEDCNSNLLSGPVRHEVHDALEFPGHITLPRVVHKRCIEHYGANNIRTLKTSYCSSNIGNNDLLTMAVEDYNQCQDIFREEFKEIERWVTENKLDQLKFAREKSAYCYFTSAATMFAPELSDARMSWAKNGVLATVVDDFFDVGGSIDELKKLVELVEKWDVDISSEGCSEHVKVIFAALHSTILEIGHKASILQARNVTGHIIEIWLDILKCMLKEAEWAEETSVPTMDEYMENGYVSFTLGAIILPALYLVGPKLPVEIVQHSEYAALFKLVSANGRLLNDMHSFKRELQEGKLNSVSLRMINGVNDGLTEADVIGEMKSIVRSNWTELRRLVVQKEGSVVPRACKDVFWNLGQALHQLFMKDDGFTSLDMSQLIKSIFYEPVMPLTSFTNL